MAHHTKATEPNNPRNATRTLHLIRRVEASKVLEERGEADRKAGWPTRGTACLPGPTPIRDTGSKPTFRAEFKPGEGGTTVVSMTRGINTRGDKGPWSEIATATVAA